MKSVVKVLSGLTLLVVASQAMAVPSGPVLAGGCDTSDLTTSTRCVGVYTPGNDSGQANIFADTSFQTVFGTGWTLLSKLEDPSWGTDASIGFSLTGTGSTSGTWMVAGNAWDSFVQGEVLGILKAGNSAAAYEIDLDSTSGTWGVTSSAWGSHALSHFSFWTKEMSTVPEPSVLALISLGVLGLGFFARRKREL